MGRIVGEVAALVEAHYVFPDVAAAVSRELSEGLAGGRYPAEARSLATAVTADLQSVNGDKHLRLLYHDQALPQRTPGDDTEEYAAIARWAASVASPRSASTRPRTSSAAKVARCTWTTCARAPTISTR